MNKATSLLLILVLSVIPSIVIMPHAAALEEQTIQTVTENSWAEMAPLPAPRSGLGVAAVDGKIYAIGGRIYQRAGDTVGTNEMYDPASNNWTLKEPMPTARALFGIVAYGGKIYCIGGETDNITATSHLYDAGLTVNEVYDPATDAWETKAPMPTARSNVEVNIADGKIYVMGGEPDQTLNYAYDLATDKWTVKAQVPNIGDGFNRAETSAASATFDGKIYWIGIVGFYDYLPGMLILNQVYNPENDSWSQRASPPDQLPGPLPEAAAVTTGVWTPERIYIFGPNKTRYVYDPSTDKWAFAKYMDVTRSEFGVAVLDDKIYVIGGAYFYTAADLNQQYTPYGYGTVGPTILTVSPQNSTFTAKDTLIFQANKEVTSMSYSLDGQDNVTFAGNLTLNQLSLGEHNVTVFATDTFGNIGASEVVTFTLAERTGSLSTVLLGVAVATVTVGVMGVLIYVKKKKRT